MFQMTNNTTASHKPSSPAVDRALAILQLLAAHDRGLGVSEISRVLDEAKSSLHAVLTTLEQRGFVIKDPATKRYRLGPQALVVGAAYGRQTNLLDAFDAVAVDLVRRCGETVQLAMLPGRHILYIGKHEGTHHVRLAAQIGGQLPAHATALGKALLSDLPDSVLDQRFADVTLERLTERTITTLPELKRELATVRARGYATDNGEVSPELRCVGVPVRDASGVVVAALSLSVPITRIDDQRAADLAQLLCDAARAMERRLGYVGSRSLGFIAG